MSAVGRSQFRAHSRAAGPGPVTIVTNGGPCRLETTRTGAKRLTRSADGLIRALTSIVESAGGTWYAASPSGGLDAAALSAAAGHKLVLIPLDDDEIRGHCREFSSRVLGPLCHSAPLDPCRFDESAWRAYAAVNARFSHSLAARDTGQGLVWIHDHHFMLLPQLLRRQRRGGPIAYFHPIPFPRPEVFGTLPWHRQMLRGLLGADLIGFHTDTYVENFLDACDAVPGLAVDFAARTVSDGEHTASVGAFPAGTDTRELEELARDAKVQTAASSIRNDLGVDKLLLAVDPVDPGKGIIERLEAVDRMLSRYPALKGVFTLVQIAVPGRDDAPECAALKQDIDAAVRRVNGIHAENGWQPVVCIARHVARRKLAAYLVAADVAVVTPLHDGMTLVAEEFCAARVEDRGVLVLSGAADAAAELGGPAVLVDPFDVDGFADALCAAMSMPPDEQRRRMRSLRSTVRRHDIYEWARDFLAVATLGPARGAPQEPRRRTDPDPAGLSLA